MDAGEESEIESELLRRSNTFCAASLGVGVGMSDLRRRSNFARMASRLSLNARVSGQMTLGTYGIGCCCTELPINKKEERIN